MPRSVNVNDERGVYQRNEERRRNPNMTYVYNQPPYKLPPGYYDPVVGEPPEYDRAEYYQRREGRVLLVLILAIAAVVAAAIWWNQIPGLGLTPTGPRSEPLTERQPTRNTATARVNVSTLYLRQGPGTQYEAIYLLPWDWEVATLGDVQRDLAGDVWVRVRVQTREGVQEGWVNQRYLRQ